MKENFPSFKILLLIYDFKFFINASNNCCSGAEHASQTSNSLQHLVRGFIDGQGNNHADFPNFPLLIALSPALRKELGHEKDRHEQTKEKRF